MGTECSGSLPRVRAGRPEDAAAIAEVLLEAPQFAMTLGQDDFPNIVELASATAIDSHGGQQTLLVAELDDAVVGYAHVHWVSALFLRGPEGYVTELFVRRTARGRGRGGALLEAIKTIALERKATRLFLVNSRQSEAYVRRFYPKHGFAEADHLASFRLETSRCRGGYRFGARSDRE